MTAVVSITDAPQEMDERVLGSSVPTQLQPPASAAPPHRQHCYMIEHREMLRR